MTSTDDRPPAPRIGAATDRPGPAEPYRPAPDAPVDGKGGRRWNLLAVVSLGAAGLSLGAPLLAGTEAAARLEGPFVGGAALAALLAVGLFGIVAAVCGALGWRRSRRGRRAARLAVAGQVLALVTMGHVALLGRPLFGTEVVPAGRLEAGDCFRRPAAADGAAVLREVSCAGPHDGWVYAEVSLAGADYPGHERLSLQAEGQCGDAREARGMEHAAAGSTVPTEGGWQAGLRVALCYVDRHR
ncbi:hypothetical protein ACIA8O_19195 [Kitasatospora sp. NPDC051853]|uniref:hypothetical protein n=1 Tax=Kitasatospora sp. NPDC051853 TaxID=3364058 RepID=UPI00379A4547